MISICISDMAFALYLIVLVQPGIEFKVIKIDENFHFFLSCLSSGFNEGRYADFVNETFRRCKWSQVIGTFLSTAPWYNFLGESLRVPKFDFSLKNIHIFRAVSGAVVCHQETL